MSSREQWVVYLPVLLVSGAVMVPAIIVAERYRRTKRMLVAAVAAVAAAAAGQLMWPQAGRTPTLVVATTRGPALGYDGGRVPMTARRSPER